MLIKTCILSDDLRDFSTENRGAMTENLEVSNDLHFKYILLVKFLNNIYASEWHGFQVTFNQWKKGFMVCYFLLFSLFNY